MKRRAALLAACALLTACAAGPDGGRASRDAPEAASGWHDKPGWRTSTTAVAAAHPLAVDAGIEILRAGGSAVDAAVAVQMVLGLVEPQSSGIGGGALLLHFDGGQVEAYDGRETAPAGADERLFLRPDGQPMPRIEAIVGGRSVGVPGAVRMLELAQREHGRLPWARLFDPAIRLAENGFPLGARLHALAAGAAATLRTDPAARSYFLADADAPPAVGTRVRNPGYARVLRRIAAEGSVALHEGELAQAIVAKVRTHATQPGSMTLQDLAGYRAKKRPPICVDHAASGREVRICGFPPPSSGGIAVAQILGLLARTSAERLPLATGFGGTPGTSAPAPSADWLHLYTEAARLAFADRAQYVADPDFVSPPAGRWTSLLEPAYLDSRARLIHADGPSMKQAPSGRPSGVAVTQAPMPEAVEHGTSHISIVDRFGHALAMTTTIEDGFGSRQMVSPDGLPGGFLLNNELTDFSFQPRGEDGRPIANRVQGGKRPRSSMAPTLVFDKATGQVLLSAGSPGGALIIHFTAKALYGVLHWGLDAQRAIDLPNFASLNGPTLLERGRFREAEVQALKARGAPVQEIEMTSGLQVLQRTPDGWFGGADPRREGIVQGD